MRRVIEVRPGLDHRIWIKFDDGTQGEVDLSDLAGRGVFRSWTDRSVFEQVVVDESGAVAWPGEIDLCPDALYLRLTGKAVEDVFPGLKATSVHA
jgi:Protein of unknown function (DUF2442)